MGGSGNGRLTGIQCILSKAPGTHFTVVRRILHYPGYSVNWNRGSPDAIPPARHPTGLPRSGLIWGSVRNAALWCSGQAEFGRAIKVKFGPFGSRSEID